jgi:demethylmenaquinone methyltransferase/2-methoxy-6-polyprenyl-1,4-benzoquinol methylase
MGSDRTKVEVKGLEARHYDFFMNLLTLGLYPGFIKKAIAGMELQPGEAVLDFGCGTGIIGIVLAEDGQKNKSAYHRS